MHRGEHLVGNVRRPRNAEELAPLGDCHDVDSKRTRATDAPLSGRSATSPRWTHRLRVSRCGRRSDAADTRQTAAVAPSTQIQAAPSGSRHDRTVPGTVRVHSTPCVGRFPGGYSSCLGPDHATGPCAEPSRGRVSPHAVGPHGDIGVIVNEAVRGHVPPAWFWALPGIDRFRTFDGDSSRSSTTK